MLAGRRKLALACAADPDLRLGSAAAGLHLYVKPNELSLEKPFIERHIEATRAAYRPGSSRARGRFSPRRSTGRIDFVANRPLLDNVRLWDWRAFHDTLSQSQPLRPYTFADTDVDRYQIDGNCARPCWPRASWT